MVGIAELGAVVVEVLLEVEGDNDTSDGCLLGVRRVAIVLAPNFVVAEEEAMAVEVEVEVEAVVVLANVSLEDGEEVQVGEGCLGLIPVEGCCLTSSIPLPPPATDRCRIRVVSVSTMTDFDIKHSDLPLSASPARLELCRYRASGCLASWEGDEIERGA
jgi:hypothetical protein